MKHKKKYKFTRQTMTLPDGTLLHRIKATHNIPEADVKKGHLGGWLEGKHNLSQSGSCWVYREAKVYGDASVSEHARAYDNVIIFGKAKLYGHAWAQENATLCGHAEVHGNAWIKGHAIIKDHARLHGHAQIDGKVILCGNAELCKNVFIGDDSIIQ